MRLESSLLFAASTVFLFACGTGQVCVPGSTQSCVCAGARTGVQTCSAEGSGYDRCDCGGTPTDGGTGNCAGRVCGSDGAGGSCGACPLGQMCTASGTCTTPPARCAGRVCGPDGAGGSCGMCAAGQACTMDGQCMSASQPCSASNPTGTCPSGQTCVNGSCCAEPCAGSCCAAGSICFRDADGNRACARQCTSSSECTGTASCCAPLVDATGAGLPYGVCAVFGAGGVSACRCTTGGECRSGFCAPSVNRDNNPVQPYVCVADSCSPYTGCSGLGSCPTGYCDLCDARGNCFCAQSCTNDSICGGAACVEYPRNNGSCGSTRACAPR